MTAWYVLRSKPRKEQSLYAFLLSQRHKAFYPTIPKDLGSTSRKAYFPCYMFIEVDLAQVGESTFRWMPFSRGLVWVGGEPGRISDPIVSALKAQIELLEQDGAELEQRYRKGELVRICGGPFEGYQAIFDVMVPGKHRVRVLLKILNDRYFPAELDASSLM